MLDIQAISDHAHQGAKALGIKQYDIYGSSVDDTGVEVAFGEPKQVEASNRASVIVRVWNEKGLVGVASTTDLDSSGICLALETAAEASAFGITDNIPDFSPEAQKPLAESTDSVIEPTPIGTLIETLVKAEKDLLESHPAITGVPYNGLSEETTERFYLNSAGAKRYESRAYASVYLYSRAEQEGKKPRSVGEMKISRDLAHLDIDGCLQLVKAKTLSHLDYQPIATGKYRVVFSPKAFLSLLGAFSNLYNAQSILDKQSLTTPETLGTAIASDLLCVSDDALHPGNIAAERFDGEGTPTRLVELIKDGVLTGLLHSAGTAKRFNTQPTGNANIGAKITVSGHFYHVYSNKTPEQTYSLDTAENVVYIDKLQALHAGVNALQGSFSLPFDGWLVNKNERQSIDAATVAGDFLEVLKSIIYLEPEAEVTPGGVCPAVWVEELAITGE
ncbi:MAG: TldD/PmbA family protein [Synechocystis sp.]